MILLVKGLAIARSLRRRLPFLPECVNLDGVVTSAPLYLGTPMIGTTAAFGVDSICVAWGHVFSEPHLHLLEAVARSEGVVTSFKLLEQLPEDWR